VANPQNGNFININNGSQMQIKVTLGNDNVSVRLIG
jgi:hypothetical protein